MPPGMYSTIYLLEIMRLSVWKSPLFYLVRYPQRFAQNDTIFLATRLYHQTIQFGKPGPPLLLSFA